MARRTVKKKTRNSKKGSKSSAGKWFLILFLLLLFSAIGGGAYLYFTGQIDQYLGDQSFFNESTDDMQTDLPGGLGQPDAALGKIAVEPPKAKSKPKYKKQTGRYLLQIGDCIYKECINTYAKAIKKAGQRMVKKRVTSKTKYFELLSEEKYNYDRAIEKIRILDNYKNTVGSAYPIKTDDGYYISFGQYPDPDLANKTLSYIDQFNTDVNIRFKMVPRFSSYKVTRVFAGPYSTKKSANYAKKQLKNLEEIHDAALVGK